MVQKLVNDVLVSVMDTMPRQRDISAMMKTCRPLYRAGPRYLLKRGVHIRLARSLVSFIAFMSVEDGARVKHLKELSIEVQFNTSNLAELLSTFLNQSVNALVLNTLRIDGAEVLLGAGSPPLSHEFARLRTITHLELLGVGRHAASFLRTMESKLEAAHITMLPFSDDVDDDMEINRDDRIGIRLLHGSQATLKCLYGHGFELLTEITGSVYAQVYPNVGQLTLAANDCPATIMYAHAFPNVRIFHYETAEEDLDIIGQELDAHVDMRALNQVQQMELDSPWKSLDECHASLIDLFLLGLRCHVRELHVLGNFFEYAYLSSVMTDTTPEYMCLKGYDVNIFTRGLVSMMGQACTQQLRSLEIKLLVGAVLKPEAVDMPRVMEIMLMMLRPLKIRSFGLLLCSCLAPQPRSANFADLRLFPAEQYLADLDLDALAQRIKDTTETLQTVVITLKMHRTRPTTIATLGADVDYEPNTVERIPLRVAPLYAAIPSLYPEQTTDELR
ncbi:hypothetical protein C8T65DRAFT_612284 [Cerioporus squamosus]|nr:hypothetical protein C8T65DRAFT_612284 [Cerioporus squamosus]